MSGIANIGTTRYYWLILGNYSPVMPMGQLQACESNAKLDSHLVIHICLLRFVKMTEKNATYWYQWIERTMSLLTLKGIFQDHQSRKTLYYNQLCFQKSLGWFFIYRVLLIKLPQVCYTAQQVLLHCSWRQAVFATFWLSIDAT